MTDAPKTLIEAVKYFDLPKCNAYMTSLKWPGTAGQTAGLRLIEPRQRGERRFDSAPVALPNHSGEAVFVLEQS